MMWLLLELLLSQILLLHPPPPPHVQSKCATRRENKSSWMMNSSITTHRMKQCGKISKEDIELRCFGRSWFVAAVAMEHSSLLQWTTRGSAADCPRLQQYVELLYLIVSVWNNLLRICFLERQRLSCTKLGFLSAPTLRPLPPGSMLWSEMN